MLMMPEHVMAAYERGDLNLTDLVVGLGRCLPDDDVARLILSLSPVDLAALKEFINEFPCTEEYWSRVRVCHIATRTFPLTSKQAETEMAEEGRMLRRGVELLRDGIGPGPKALDPFLLAWGDRAIPRVARAILDEKAFERMPILADALEEAGVHEEEILGHLRGSGPHHRCCWCLRLILSSLDSH
jgi:hypothetical protein